MKNKDNKLKFFLILHNFEDLKGMLTVINLLAYNNIFQGYYNYKNIEFDKDGLEIIIHLELNSPIITRISYSMDNIYMTAYDNKLKFLIKLYKGTLKFFYNDYKDYYYLPKEDTALHKSVAEFVDRDFRKQATARTCYTWKPGSFLPQWDVIFTPVFKTDYNDDMLYFELTDEIKKQPEEFRKYALHLLDVLIHAKEK